jgi:5-methylcytosine-specific restriction endonuclease McrA
LFNFALKRQLWEADPTCKYEECGNQILTPDDAEVDHVDFYWRGGETIPKNARLLHRYCNRKRGGRS